MKQKDIHRVRLPVPFFVNHVYVHLIENLDDSSLILIDCGPATEDAFITLASYVKSIGYAMEDIEACIVTHSHYEHYGLLERIKQKCNVTIFAHPAMLNFASIDFNEVLSSLHELLVANGMPIETVDNFLKLYRGIITETPMPLIDEVVNDGEYVSTNPGKLRIIWTPGHAEDHICVYDEETGIMFTGDHVISGVTPQIGLTYIAQLENPLKIYQQSLQELLNYNIELSFPGHNKTIENTHERVLEILRHHKSREQWILEALDDKKLTAFEIRSKVFGEKQPAIGHHIISYTETIAHLKSLKVSDKVNELVKEGIHFYEKLSL
ncbi:MAG: MBL fold metallo-hydrolase [Promethearchaeota archaeon]